jgi:hypothetical protein
MNKFENEINILLNKILTEEITKKSKKMSEKFHDNEWVEIDTDEMEEINDPEIDEEETQEGNAFTGALAKAKQRGEKSFEVDGKKYSVNEKYLRLTEDELIDLIEKLVIEEQNKESNISKKDPIGLTGTNNVLNKSKKDNDDYVKDVSKKMMDYLKDMSEDKYESNPEKFPVRNGDKNSKNKKYTPSDAVEEYIENFAHPGMENLHYDEIKPNEEWVSDNIEGSSRTGNNPEWANAVKTDLGKKINKKRKTNLYQKEKDRSYKRERQPIDTAGENKDNNSIDKMFQKLESKEDKKTKVISEEIGKMKNLIEYNRKTQ